MALNLVSNFHTRLHQQVTGKRRVKVLARELAALLPDQSTLLDVGCGSGEIARNILEIHPQMKIEGIDVLVRPDTAIPVHGYDGRKFPVADKSFDYVSFVDVLHHTTYTKSLLQEAMHVARKGIVIKDHNCNNKYTRRLLSFTDWFGNRSYGVKLVFRFWSHKRWTETWTSLGLTQRGYIDSFGLYPFWTRVVFPKDMDFIVLLELN